MTLTVGKNETSGDDGGEPELVVKCSVLGGFSESDEIRALIASLPEISENAATKEVATEKFLGETIVVICASIHVLYIIGGNGASHNNIRLIFYSHNGQIPGAASSSGSTSW